MIFKTYTTHACLKSNIIQHSSYMVVGEAKGA